MIQGYSRPLSADGGGGRHGNTVPSHHLPVSKSLLPPDPVGGTNSDHKKIVSGDYFNLYTLDI